MTKKLYLVTQNQGKIKELTSLLNIAGWQIEVLPLPTLEIQDLDILTVADYKMTSALQQARQRKLSGYLVIDDTSLEIAALNGLPGTLVKWFLARLDLRQLAKLKVSREKTARAVCVLGLGEIASDSARYFRGETLGIIGLPGLNKGFGWDDIFYPLGEEKSYAALSTARKNRLSHRGKAARNLAAYLRNL